MSVAGPDLAPGARFGEYEILAELGGGGMGRVYRAKDLTLERDVAIKTLAPQFGADPGFVQRFLREARAAARLNHPNIVQIYAFGNVGDCYYLAMEYVDGYSLGRYVRRGSFPEHDAVVVVRHAARALGFAHAHGLVHRDIKPENVMLTQTGVVKIVDLGIAKELGEEKGLTQTGLVVGTPQYVSPEQVKGMRDVDARADVYSLGATLYHLVTGRPPYDGDSGAIVMFKHLIEPLPDPRTIVPDLSEGLCRVVARMMAKDRDERYPDMDAVDRDLYRVEVGEEPEAGEPAPHASAVDFTSAPTVAPRPPAGTPPATPAPAFDSATLRRIEDALASDVGPMARVLVKQLARTAPSLDALCDTLAGQVPEGARREAFRGRCVRAAHGAATPAHPTPAAPVPPTSAPAAPRSGPTAALREDALRLVETELARHVGPLARLLVKKAARQAGSTEELLRLLEAEIPTPASRTSFRAAMRRIDSA